MRSSTRLSSAVFQLTPTRTRCDLVILANDKKEKLASGLLEPFLSHLKIAQEQIAKGGYSILLEPPNDADTSWFTKATLERFVRFVSTPEVLERVYTIETEIIQIVEAISMQRSNDVGQINVEEHFPQSVGVSEGDKSVPSACDEKGIVLYQPGPQTPEANASCLSDGNSKAQLLNILETRKTVLQKEQGMAFARAAAAGFDIDHIDPLVSFARCFGAMRLMEACSRFLDLWKRKHETGQWLDVEASEVASSRTDFAAMNASGSFVSSMPIKCGDHDVSSENNGKLNSANNTDSPAPNGQQGYLQGQFPHQVFSPWPAVHGSPQAFPTYPVQGMPYYHPYAGPFLLPHHLPMEHFPSNFNHQSGQKKEPVDSRDVNTGSEAWETDGIRTQLDMDSEMKDSEYCKPRKRSGGSKRNQSGVVVIRNINYIDSKQRESGSETESDSSCSGTDIANGDFEVDGGNVIHKNGRSSESKGSLQKSVDKLKAADDELSMFGNDAGDSHWQAFQNCLLRGSSEDAIAENGAVFETERGVKIKRRGNSAIDDPLALGAGDTGVIHDSRTRDNHRISGVTRKPRGLNDDVLLSSHGSNGSMGNDGQTAFQFSESNGRTILSRTEVEDYIISDQQKQSNYRNLLDVNSYEGGNHKIDRESSSHGMNDEAFIVPFRSMSLDHAYGADRTSVHMDTETSSSHKKSKGGKESYEPDCLSLMPERGAEKNSPGVDPALDYEMQVCAEGLEGKVRRNANAKGGLGKSLNDRKSKVAADSLSKRRTGGPIKKESRPLKMSPMEDARARAERLRSYKAELQKMKKEKEEEEAKRLAKLKLERQKRIAARANPIPLKPSTLSPQTKPLQSKLPSPIANRGSKFSDSELGSSSPLQRSKIKTSPGSSMRKTPMPKRLNEGSHNPGNRLTKSSSSIPETKRANNGITPDSKATTMGRIKRLSEPKITTYPSATSAKAGNAEAVVKRKLFDASDKNKMTAIVSLDQSKAATLPELKIKPSKSQANGECVSPAKDDQSMNGNAESHANNCKAEESPIVEKTVVMLEKPSVPTFPSLETNSEKWYGPHYDEEKGERSRVATALDSNHAQVDKETIAKVFDSSEKHTGGEKPYKALHARNSSLEYAVETSAPLVEMEKQVETSEKTFVKEPSKGLRNLLKFGKKLRASTSVDQSVDSECSSRDGTERDNHHGKKVASSSEVDTLKNLIYESSTSGNAPPQKASRHFSLLSPFRSKTSEKKQTS